MTNRKANLEGIDEDFLLESIHNIGKVDPVPPREPPPTVAEDRSKEPKGRKRHSPQDYGSIFLQRNEITNRKSVYISRDIHDMISDIVTLVGGNRIGVGGYVDTVLRHHLEMNRDQINELYRKRLEKNEIVSTIKNTE